MGGLGIDVTASGERAIDERTVEWQRVIAARYHVYQMLRYEYDSPISNLHNRLIITPRRRHLDQQRVANHLWTSASGPLAVMPDEFGNDIADVDVAHVEREIVFTLESAIVRDSRFANTGATSFDLFDPRWIGGSRLTRPNDRIFNVATELRSRFPNDRELALEIMHFVHANMTYTKGVTDVFTTASTAFSQGRGVCQDFAHIAISIARAAGLSARYVSGHLLGEGATHAWTEFLVNDRTFGPTVLTLDPTYDTQTTFRYVTVAIGRDYDDVPPTSGYFNGDAAGKLNGQQLVRLMDVTYAAA
jgi:transglutaminase-like putative cysteine protease